MIDKSILLDDKKFTVGIFDDSDKLLHAVHTLKEKGVKIFDCYTPFPVHHLDKALGYNRTNLSIGAFLCGMLGSLTGFTLAYYMNVVDWPMIIGGKPQDISVFTSFIPVIFELTILFTAFGMVIMFFARSRMIHGIKEDLLSRRQTDDHMVLAIDNDEDQDVSSSDIQAILRGEGAIEVSGSREAFHTSLNDEETLAQITANNHTSEPVLNVTEPEVAAEEPAPALTKKAEKVVLTEDEKEERLNVIKSTLGDASGAKDDLKLISGVGPKYEETLNSIGIYTFEQISKMTLETIKAVEEITNYFPGRIERDDWINQAKKLMSK
ncbi:MAG: quinol:electron acceptor oxidoreductase subunit ActD [Bacteroidia bacterium]